MYCWQIRPLVNCYWQLRDNKSHWLVGGMGGSNSSSQGSKQAPGAC